MGINLSLMSNCVVHFDIRPVLGVRWGSDERTQDLDFAHAGKQLSLALPSNATLDLSDAISKLEIRDAACETSLLALVVNVPLRSPLTISL